MAKPKSPEAFFSGLDISDLSLKAQILLIAYYMRLTGRTEFLTKDLEDEFVHVLLPAPGSLGVRLAQLAKGRSAPLLRVAVGKYSLSLFGLREVEAFIKTKPGTTAASPDAREAGERPGGFSPQGDFSFNDDGFREGFL